MAMVVKTIVVRKSARLTAVGVQVPLLATTYKDMDFYPCLFFAIFNRLYILTINFSFPIFFTILIIVVKNI